MAITKKIKKEASHSIKYYEDGPIIWHDADWIPYAVGSVCQTLVETVHINGRLKFEAETKKELYENFKVKDKAELDDKMANDPRWKGVVITKEFKLEPIENVLNSVNKTIQRIVDELGASDQKLFITVGSNNFRNEIATLNKYKANRSGVEKPHYYPAIRDHMIAHHGAVIAEGMEAEDPVVTGHYQAHKEWIEDLPNKIRKGEVNPLVEGSMECPHVMVSVDKDTFQTAGQHYDPKTSELRWISELGECRLITKYHETKKLKNGDRAVKDRKIKFTGLKGLYLQMLQGDDIDNIPGLAGFGPVNLFETMNELLTEKEMYRTVLGKYEEGIGIFMAEQDTQDEIRRLELDYSWRSADTKQISAIRAKAKAARKKQQLAGELTSYEYYHWDQFETDEFGAPTLELIKGHKSRMSKTPLEMMQEVATLLWIRHVEVKDGECVDAPIGNFRPEL